MKGLMTQYHALDIADLARGGWLCPFSKYHWVWRTNKGAHQTTVTIKVLKDSLLLVFLIGPQRVHQAVQLTYSIGPQGGKRPWFVCPTCRHGLARCITWKTSPFDAVSVVIWPIPRNTNHEIKVTAVNTGC